ncbi:hypothetical protein [Streptomyces sp. NPDC001380]|uniref:hypothetical protein n=1 Tax=Streptomyces sp. NPDC001380 TaxID=3364566 RepID=UPI0036A61415
MISEPALRGYLLEEVLAWLLQSSGYELLTVGDDSPDVLDVQNHGLVVRGRGAWHQADVLGEFRYVPPFSLPVRLFLEAKFTKTRVPLSVVRNGHGVVHDVNENHVSSPRSPQATPRRPRARFRYSYAIFATGGFTSSAQEYALAHQLSLIDLSLPGFQGLRDLILEAAKNIHEEMRALPKGELPSVQQLRGQLRPQLNGDYPDAYVAPGVAEQISMLARGVHGSAPGLILAFPPAPFVLGLVPADLRAFVDYALAHPTHTVNLRRMDRAGAHRTWALRPAAAPSAYTMTFGLPRQVEEWVLDQDESVSSRTRWVKQRLLSTMTIYWLEGDHAHTFHLRYEPAQLREA